MAWITILHGNHFADVSKMVGNLLSCVGTGFLGKDCPLRYRKPIRIIILSVGIRVNGGVGCCSLNTVFAQSGIVLDFPRTNTNTCLLLWKETVVLYIAALNTGAKIGKKIEITLIYERNLQKCIIFYYYLTRIARITLIFFTNLFILTSICPAELAENAENILQKQKIHLLRYYSSKEPYVLSVMSVFLKTSFYTTVTSLSTSTVVAIIPQSAKTTFHWKTIYTLWIHHIMNLKNKPADRSGLRS